MAMEVRRVIPDAHTSAILSVAYNHHRREYVTGGQDGAIKMWEHDTGKHLRTLVDGHLGWVMGLRYAGPLRMLFSTSIDSYLMVWDTRAKCEWFQRIKMEAQGHCIEYDERRALVYVGSNKVIRVFSVIKEHADEPSRRREILKWTQTIKGVHDDYVRAIVVTDTGRLFSTGYDSSLCLYDVIDSNGLRDVKFVPSQQKNCHTGAISTAAFDWENNLMITGSFDKSVKVWSPEGKLLQTFGPLADTLTGLCYVPATRMIWMSANSTAPVIFDPRTGTNVTNFQQPPSVRSIMHGSGADDANDDGRATGTEKVPDRLLRLFSVRSTNEIIGATSSRALIIWRYNQTGASSVLVGHTDWVEVVCYTRKLELDFDEPQVRLFSAGSDALVRIWEPASRLNAALYHTTGKFSGHEGAVLCGAFCDEANAFVTGSDDCTIRVWFQPTSVAAAAAMRQKYTADQPTAPPDALPGAQGESRGVGSAPPTTNELGLNQADTEEEKRFDPAATAAAEEAAAAAEYLEATCVVLEGHEERISGVCVLGLPAAPGTLVSVSWDLTIRWWRLLPSEKEDALIHTIENAHDDYIHGVAYSPLTHQIATCSADQGAKVWDAQRRTLVATLSGHQADVTHVAWSGVHSVWVTSSDDQSIKLWSTLGRQLRHIDTRDAISALAIDRNYGYVLAAFNDSSYELRVYNPALDQEEEEGEEGGEEEGEKRAAEQEPFAIHAHVGHTDCIRHIEHIPEKGQYLTASWDHTIRTWRQVGDKGRSGSFSASSPLAGNTPLNTNRAHEKAGEGEEEEGEMFFADRYPLRLPKALQKESSGRFGLGGGGGAGGDSSRRRRRKPAEAIGASAGQSGMALRLNDLLADREVALKAQLKVSLSLADRGNSRTNSRSEQRRPSHGSSAADQHSARRGTMGGGARRLGGARVSLTGVSPPAPA